MGLYIEQRDTRTELQERLVKELQEKAKNKDMLQNSPDGVEDSKYVQSTSRTGKYAWLWILLIFVLLGLSVYLTVVSQIG